MFKPAKNPDFAAIKAIVNESTERAARKIVDPRDGSEWYWAAEQATHAEGADKLGIPYDRPPGAGDIVTLD